MDADLLARLVLEGGDPPARAWFGEVLARLGQAADVRPLAADYAAAGRRLGRAGIRLLASDRAAGAPDHLEEWSVADCGRAVLLLRAAARLPAPAHLPLVDELYRKGDLGEKQAVLRSLPLLPDPARFVELAVEACRSSARPVFEAIACANPYPAGYFPDGSFNQMVLKALFTEVSVGRILGIDRRITPELLRMADAYASERRAAGRPVPADVQRLNELLGGRGR